MPTAQIFAEKIEKSIAKKQERLDLLDRILEQYYLTRNEGPVRSQFTGKAGVRTVKMALDLLHTQRKRIAKKIERAKSLKVDDLYRGSETRKPKLVVHKNFKIKNGVLSYDDVLYSGRNQLANDSVFKKTARSQGWIWYHAAVRGGGLAATRDPRLRTVAKALALVYSKHWTVYESAQGVVHCTEALEGTPKRGTFLFHQGREQLARASDLCYYFHLQEGAIYVTLGLTQNSTHLLQCVPSRGSKYATIQAYVRSQGLTLDYRALDQLVPNKWDLILKSLNFKQ